MDWQRIRSWQWGLGHNIAIAQLKFNLKWIDLVLLSHLYSKSILNPPSGLLGEIHNRKASKTVKKVIYSLFEIIAVNTNLAEGVFSFFKEALWIKLCGANVMKLCFLKRN